MIPFYELPVRVQNLISVSKEEISLIPGLEKDAAKLNENLEIIQKFLNDVGIKFITDKVVGSWEKMLAVVVFDAGNVLDELNYGILSKKMNKMKKLKKLKKLKKVKKVRKMKEINMRFESINKKASELGIEKRLADAHAAPDAGSETDSFTVDPIFIGRDNDESKIVEMLTTIPTEQVINKEWELINEEASTFDLQMRLVGAHAPGAGSDAFAGSETDSFTVDPIFIGRDNDVSKIVETDLFTGQVFSIFGMGGLGKTTLTRNVFNDENIKTHFGLTHIWPRASRLTSERVEAESKRKWDNFIRVLEECSMHDLNPDFILEASGDNWRRMYVVKSEINKSETLRAESHSHQQSNSRFLRLVRLVVNVKLWVDRAKKRVLALEGLRVHKKQKIVRDLNLLADTASEVG